MLALGVFSLTQNTLSSNSSFAMESKENATEKQPQQTEKKANDSKEVENSTDNLTDLEKQRVKHLKEQLAPPYVDKDGNEWPGYCLTKNRNM